MSQKRGQLQQVALGLEEVDIELSELQAFEDAIEDVRKRFGLQLEPTLLNRHRTVLKEKAAEKTLMKLESETGWVSIEGKYKVEMEGDFYRCTYVHPVTNYIKQGQHPITISVLLPATALEPTFAGNYAVSVDKWIPLRIYAQVWQPVGRKTSTWQLQLTPVAVY